MIAWFRDRWFCLWNANERDKESEPGQLIYLATSRDGLEWSEPELAFAPGGRSRNPVPCKLVQWQPGLIVMDDELWCFWSQLSFRGKEKDESYGCWFSRLQSPDGQWENRRLLWEGSPDVSLDGHSWRILPMVNPVALASGRVLVPVSLIGPKDPGAPDGVWGVHTRNSVLWSDDRGETWHCSAGNALEDEPWAQWEPTVWERPDGGVAMLSRRNDARDPAAGGPRADHVLVSSNSMDAGETWSRPEVLPFRTIVSRMHVIRLGADAHTPSRFVLCHNDSLRLVAKTPYLRFWNWHYVAASVDPANEIVRFHVHDRVSGAHGSEFSFDSKKLSHNSGDQLRIGRHLRGDEPGDGFRGDIAWLGLFDGQVFTEGDHAKLRDVLYARLDGENHAPTLPLTYAPELEFDANQPAEAEQTFVFPEDSKGGVCVVSRTDEGGELVFHGQSSAAIEHRAEGPLNENGVEIRFRFRQTGDGAVTTLGDAGDPVRFLVENGRSWLATESARVDFGPLAGNQEHRLHLHLLPGRARACLNDGETREIRHALDSPAFGSGKPFATIAHSRKHPANSSFRSIRSGRGERRRDRNLEMLDEC